jgi:dihydroneopterin aldolase
MLASVRTLDEALLALRLGADLIDLKEPSRGALGALDHAAVRVMARAVAGRRPVSATVGDIASMDPGEMVAAVEKMAATGVDYVKIGFFAHEQAHDCARALTALAARARLVAVIFADEPWQFDSAPLGRGAGEDLPILLDAVAESGFAGAMLDTAGKNGKSLRDWRSDAELRGFARHARRLGLLTGLAGSLRKDDVGPLLPIEPDYLGFRGALCRNAQRGQVLEESAFLQIRAAIPREPDSSRASRAVAA